MATSKNKKPVTVNNAKGKTVYDPNKRTITTYNKKGKTVVDKDIYSDKAGTTVYNKKGSVRKTLNNAYNYDIKNKKGQITADDPTATKGLTIAYSKKGTEIYNRSNNYKTIEDSKGRRDVPVKAPVKTPAKPKTDSKKAIPASDSRYKNMTPAQRNANTLKNVKESIGSTKKTDVKKPADTKKPVTVVNAKGKTTYDPKARTVTTYNSKGKTIVDKNPNSENYGTTVINKKGVTKKLNANDNNDPSIVTINKKGHSRTYGKKGDEQKMYAKIVKDKAGFTRYENDFIYKVDKKGEREIPRKTETKKATNLPEVKVTPPKKTTPASNNTSIEQKAKDAMSGKYGTGAARKTALGSDYAKVQAIVNKKATATKAKPTGPSKGTVATMQKNIKDEQEGRLKFDEPVASVSTKSTEVKPEVKPAAVDVDKSIDAAMKGIAKSKIMKKGGTVKMKYSGSMKTKKR